MAKKNFMAYGDAETIFTEYAGALNRKLNCFSGTKEEFLALSVAERKKYEYVLDPTADVVVYAVMDEVDDVELTFTNDVATVSIPGVTAKSKIWVFYSDASYDVAKAADITVTSGSGIVTFTAANTPTDTITCDILYYLKKDTTNFASVVGGGGHEIQDNGTAMAQEDALNFIDHDLTDDSTNGATVVKPHRFSAAEMAEICSPLPDAPTLVGNVRMTLLWTNPDTSQSRGAGDVVDNVTSDKVLIQCLAATSSDVMYTPVIIDKGFRGASYATAPSSSNVQWYRRMFIYKNNKVSMATGETQTQGSSVTTNASIVIPYKVYGIDII